MGIYVNCALVAEPISIVLGLILASGWAKAMKRWCLPALPGGATVTCYIKPVVRKEEQSAVASWRDMSDRLVNEFLLELEQASHRCENLLTETDARVRVDDGL